jgi:hypothetical protein
MMQRIRFTVLLTTLLLLSCGGQSQDRSLTSSSLLIAQEAAAPVMTGHMTSDGLNWMNFRRLQAGLAAVQRNSSIDRAAQAHADYQRLNNVVTHDEIAGQPGFTGVDAPARLRAAGYALNTEGYSEGEVIAATAQSDGFAAAEGLMAAIYHRFVILEPMFTEAGIATARRTGGYSWLTANFIRNTSSGESATGRMIVWPFSDQRNVRVNFFSNQESPDPVMGRDEVGFPVSVHADIGARVIVENFTVRARGEMPLETRLLERANDPDTPQSAAAIIPLSPLRPMTIYDVQFNGSINGIPLSRSWSFVTR